MKQELRQRIAVQVHVKAPLEEVWECWNNPSDIVQWNTASQDWHTTEAKNDLYPGGSFRYRMEAKNGSQGFIYEGVYSKVVLLKQIDYTIGDGRMVMIAFAGTGAHSSIVETFEAEHVNPLDLQRQGWQSILNSFKHYVERKYMSKLMREHHSVRSEK